MTSHDVVAIVRRRWKTRAVGHTGTLDPFATGLLVLVLGGATRLARFVERGTKEYRVRAVLGTRTETDDPTGEPLGPTWAGAWPDAGAVTEALRTLVGRQLQRPPAYSAKRVGGQRSHRLARRGLAVELAPVEVRIDELALERYEAPVVEFRATVGPGTYVRSIVRDLGERLGVGAHAVELRRERVGPFRADLATPLERLTGTEPLLPPADLVGELPRVRLAPDEVRAVGHGRTVAAEPEAGDLAALVDESGLVAVAEARGGRWQPIVVLGRA
jgi:tRNA pseudouridine55 synthase